MECTYQHFNYSSLQLLYSALKNQHTEVHVYPMLLMAYLDDSLLDVLRLNRHHVQSEMLLRCTGIYLYYALLYKNLTQGEEKLYTMKQYDVVCEMRGRGVGGVV